MTMHELETGLSTATCTAKVRATPEGEIKLTRRDPAASAYGPVEIAWYPDHLEVRALGAGRAAIRKGYLHGSGDLIVEIRPPSVGALVETVPGAD